MSGSFEVKIPLFEGPFDLLLFFIKRDELDIHDIPIAQITLDFLDYLKRLEALNIEVASEFILVAATLVRIKVKMLLPRVEVDEEGQEIDPRADLVKHLLEYKKYKSVVSELVAWEDNMLQRDARGNIAAELKTIAATADDVEAELEHVDLYQLLQVFQKIMKRYELEQHKPVHQVTPFPYRVEDQKSLILDWVGREGKVAFSALIAADNNRIAVIFNFLAILELMATNQIGLVIGEGFNNFWVTPYQQPTEVAG
jgi:segregation and condensation protein A